MTTSIKTLTPHTIAPAGRWTVDPRHSLVEFAVKHLVIATVKGRFRDFEGSLEVNAVTGDVRGHGVASATGNVTFYYAPNGTYEPTRVELAFEGTANDDGTYDFPRAGPGRRRSPPRSDASTPSRCAAEHHPRTDNQELGEAGRPAARRCPTAASTAQRTDVPLRPTSVKIDGGSGLTSRPCRAGSTWPASPTSSADW